MNLQVVSAVGVEASVKRELKQLGYGDRPAVNGRISLVGDWQDIARLNVFLRAGERVLVELACFPATTFDELFDGVSRIPWEEYLSAHSKILMDGKSVKSVLGAVKAAGGVVKKAIVERLKQKLGATTLDEKGERAVVGVSILENTVSITLDTSGDGLHKRGYRVLTYDAPLRETTAAAIVEDSYFHAGKAFADVFCGSGTIPIEAALYANRIAPGGKRDFDFAHWKCCPRTVLAAAKEEANDGVIRSKTPIFASDVSPRAISIAKKHAERAGVADCISFRVADMRQFSSQERYGVMVCNPPYGERLSCDLPALYRDFGKMYRALPDWSCYFITSYENAERAFGERAQKKRKLFNAHLPCGLYCYFGKKPVKICENQMNNTQSAY